MATSGDLSQKVVPAQLDFLAIYNPSLGTTEETLDDSIVYFSSAEIRKRHRSRVTSRSYKDVPHEEKNEWLRQIGLAQGMVEFGKSFSNGKSVDAIETQKSIAVLHELEPGWWILASVDLTRLPSPPKSSSSITTDKTAKQDSTIEYSSREVKAPALLLQDLLRAHAIFLLHHASSMSALFVRTRRSKFIDILGQYWDSFISTWNVLLHGNPAVNMYGGIKLAASGELGIGVGEEDRGSGEREVLEGFVGRIDGLVDLVVSRFGSAYDDTGVENATNEDQGRHGLPQSQPWLGTGAEPASGDGAIFLGTGALSRKSLRDVAYWVEDLWTWGPYAYGVIDNPTSTRGTRRVKKHRKAPVASSESSPSSHSASGLNQPQISLSLHDNQTRRSNSSVHDEATPHEAASQENTKLGANSSIQSITSNITTSRLANYFKLGYGTHWTLGSTSKTTLDPAPKKYEEDRSIPPRVTDTVALVAELNQAEPQADGTPGRQIDLFDDSKAHWLIGLQGDLEHGDQIDEYAVTPKGGNESGTKKAERIMLRTVTVELERGMDARPEADISIELGSDSEQATLTNGGTSQHTNISSGSYEGQDRNKTKKLRVAVYINKPFIYVFFFELRTESLSLASLYHSLHHQLAPLQLSLLTSTQQQLARPEVSTIVPHDSGKPIYDLLWDAKSMTISSTIPNIPDGPYHISHSQSWSRMEALNTHIQIINTFVATRTDKSELERTSKTSRGWWVVWTRIPVMDDQQQNGGVIGERDGRSDIEENDERGPRAEIESKGRNSDGVMQSFTTSASDIIAEQSNLSAHNRPDSEPELAPHDLDLNYKEIVLIRRAGDNTFERRFSSGTFTSNEGGWGSGPAKLAQGIGVDTKRYIEGLLSLYP